MIIFVGDWIRPVGHTSYRQVIDIVDSMSVLASDGIVYNADHDEIDSVLSDNEHMEMVNNVCV